MFILKYIFFGSLVILLIPLLFCIYTVQRIEKNALRNSVFGLLLSQTGMVMLYGMALMTVDEKLALFFYALFYFCVDFMTLLLFIYSRVYADTYRHKVWMRPVTYILLLTDAIVLFSNLRVQNVFHVAPMTDQFGNVYYGCKKLWYLVWGSYIDLLCICCGMSDCSACPQVKMPKNFSSKLFFDHYYAYIDRNCKYYVFQV